MSCAVFRLSFLGLGVITQVYAHKCDDDVFHVEHLVPLGKVPMGTIFCG
jgi:hypothetical protein